MPTRLNLIAPSPSDRGNDAVGLIDGPESPADKSEPILLLTGWHFYQEEALFARRGGQAFVERDDLE